MPAVFHSAAPHLEALTAGALAWDARDRARLRVTGADARALLHRLSTNHVDALAKGDGRLNALLTDKGRIVDVVHHLDRGEDGVLLLGSRGRGPSLLAWLDRYLFTEAVELADLSGAGSCAEVAGARAGAVVDALVPGAAALAPWAFVERGGRVVVRGFDRVDASGARVPGFVVVELERPDAQAALGALTDAGAEPIDAAAAEALRVAAGVPGEAGELVDAFNPLDLALHDAIHWAKGCYIGQEVIARLDTYAKQGKQLVGLVLDDATRARLRAGDPLLLEGKAAGAVTSVSPLFNGALPSALAELKGASPPTALTVRLADGAAEATAVLRAAAQPPHA